MTKNAIEGPKENRKVKQPIAFGVIAASCPVGTTTVALPPAEALTSAASADIIIRRKA